MPGFEQLQKQGLHIN